MELDEKVRKRFLAALRASALRVAGESGLAVAEVEVVQARIEQAPDDWSFVVALKKAARVEEIPS